MTPLQTLRLHLNEYERFIQRATEMEAGIREEESGTSISNAYWETAYEAVFGTSKDVHSALRALNTVVEPSSLTGNLRSARIANIVSPTAPVAPTTATLYCLLIVNCLDS